MAAGKYNFVVEQGTQHDVDFRYKLASGSYEDLSPIAIDGVSTSWKIQITVKDHITDTAYVYRATSNGTADAAFKEPHLSGVNEHFTIAADQVEDKGKFSLSIDNNTTELFTFNQGVYDLVLIAPDGTTTKILEGKFKIKLSV